MASPLQGDKRGSYFSLFTLHFSLFTKKKFPNPLQKQKKALTLYPTTFYKRKEEKKAKLLP